MAVARQAGTHVFQVSARWSGDERRGEVGLGGAQPATITVPQAFGGARPGTNPEELLLASALSCYLMTLAGVAARRNLTSAWIEATIVGEVSRTPAGLRFDRIRLRPVIHVAGMSAEERHGMGKALCEAEAQCFIARTLRPVIPYELEPCFIE